MSHTFWAQRIMEYDERAFVPRLENSTVENDRGENDENKETNERRRDDQIKWNQISGKTVSSISRALVTDSKAKLLQTHKPILPSLFFFILAWLEFDFYP